MNRQSLTSTLRVKNRRDKNLTHHDSGNRLVSRNRGMRHPDPWGSRWRDPEGHWTFADKTVPLVDSRHVHGTPKTFAIGPAGLTRYQLQHKIVDANDLIVSNDPFTFEANSKFPADLQPRSRSRAANKAQVGTMAANLSPDALLVDFHSIDRGSPIVNDKDIVESGNGRVMAIIRASQEYPKEYQKYRHELDKAAGDLGLSIPGTIHTPILVRQMLTDVNQRAFVEEANGRAALSQSAVEQARTDARHITNEMLANLEVREGQSVADALKSQHNQNFTRAVIGKLPPTEQAELVDSKGQLSLDGVRRITMAIFVKAFPGDNGLMLAERAFESTDDDVKNAINGLAIGLGPLVKAETLIKDGQRAKNLTFQDDVAAAINVYAKIKATPGLSVDKYLNQGQLLERELTPFQESVLRFLDANKRSSKAIGDAIGFYSEKVIDQSPPSQSTMFGGETVTKESLWESATSKKAMKQQEALL